MMEWFKSEQSIEPKLKDETNYSKARAKAPETFDALRSLSKAS